jgi:hypothetical protein
MKILATCLVVTALGGLLGLVLPFWSLALAGLVVGGLLRPGGWPAFVGAALGGMLLWGGLAVWADAANAGILSARIAAVFGASVGMLKLITAVLGGLLAGLGGLLGHRLRRSIS